MSILEAGTPSSRPVRSLSLSVLAAKDPWALSSPLCFHGYSLSSVFYHFLLDSHKRCYLSLDFSPLNALGCIRGEINLVLKVRDSSPEEVIFGEIMGSLAVQAGMYKLWGVGW